MKAEEIREHVRTQPFRPIRVHVTDGASYEVHHPEMMLVTRMEIVIGIEPGNSGIPERSIICAPSRIARIEPIDHTECEKS